MIFETERELQQKIAKLDFEFYENYPVTFTRRELRVGGCIPDLVGVNFFNDPFLYSWPQTWSYRHSFVVWLLRNRPLRIDEIASSFFEPVAQIKPLIDNLIASEIVEAEGRKFLLAKHVLDDLRSNVIAVEAKLRNWRQALSQAIRYKDFANIVFVAMDASMIPAKESALEQFRNVEVGLCAISKHCIDWIIYPTNREGDMGHEKEYITMSSVIPTTQRFWSRRKKLKASTQA